MYGRNLGTKSLRKSSEVTQVLNWTIELLHLREKTLENIWHPLLGSK
jgi:hypothetical protein